ncbi:hypothetical protein GCM10027091_67400 [Streptomyces daliensis]
MRRATDVGPSRGATTPTEDADGDKVAPPAGQGRPSRQVRGTGGTTLFFYDTKRAARTPVVDPRKLASQPEVSASSSLRV